MAKRSNRAHKAGLMGALAGFLDGLNRNWQTAKAQEAQALKEQRLAEIRAQERSEDREFQLGLMDKQHENQLESAEVGGAISRDNAEFTHELTADERAAAQRDRQEQLRLQAAGVGNQGRQIELAQQQFEATDTQNRWTQSEDAEKRRREGEARGFILNQDGTIGPASTQDEAAAAGKAFISAKDFYSKQAGTQPYSFFGQQPAGTQPRVANPQVDPYFQGFPQQ